MRPRVIILLGRHAALFFLKRYADVSGGDLKTVAARPFSCRLGDFETPAVATLHPTGAQMARGGSGNAYAATVRIVAELLGD